MNPSVRQLLLGSVAAPYLGQVATQCRIPTTVLAGGNTQVMSRTRHIARSSFNGLQAIWPNWICGTNNGGLESGPGGSATITAALIYNGVAYQFTWSGSTSVVVADKSNTPLSDPIQVSISEGDAFFIHTYYVNSVGVLHEGGGTNTESLDATNGEVFRRAASGLADQTMTVTPPIGGTGSTAFRYGPIALVATTRKPSVLIIGDSIAQGERSSAYGTPAAPAAAGEDGDKGIIARALGRSLAYIQVAQGGSQLNNFMSTGDRALRMTLAPYVSHVLTNHGRNDIRNGARTAAQVAAQMTEFAALFPGKKVFCGTLVPTTTGAWTLADGSDQTVSTTNSWNTQSALYNGLVRAGIAGISGYFEYVFAACRPGDESKWFADGTVALMTDDGTHPSTFAEQRIRSFAVLDTNRIRRTGA